MTENMIGVRVRATAGDRKTGMTLAELALFLKAAQLSNIPEDAPVRVGTGFRGQIQYLETPR